MNCPDTETLISFAMNPLAEENEDFALHIHGCPECRMNLRLVNESLLADDWCSSGGQGAERDIGKYIRVLDRDMKDKCGRWLHKGDEVLVDPEDPLNVERATDEARKRFVANGFGFRRNLPPETESALKRVASEINRFGSAIAENMRCMVGRTIPGKNLPWWVNLIPYPLTVAFRKQREITAHGNRCDLSAWMSQHGFIPNLETVSTAARRMLEESCFFRVWELTCGPICFRVFAVYVAPIAIESMKCGKADISLYNGIKQFIHEWESRNCAKANCKCYILGASPGWEGFSTVDLPDAVEILCSPTDAGESWMIGHRDLSSYRRVFRTFVYALYPETVEQRRARVGRMLESKAVSGSQTAEKLAKACGIPTELVEEVFDDLQRDPQSGWMNYITEDGRHATRPRRDGVGRGAIEFRKHRLPVVQVVLSIGILAAIALGLFAHLKMAEYGIFPSALLIFTASCAKGYCERRLA